MNFFRKEGYRRMARQREPIDLIAAKGRKHLTKSEYDERKNSEVIAPSDNVKAPSFLSKNEQKKFDFISQQLIELKIMTNLDCDVLARYIRAETEYMKVSKQLSKIKFIPDKKSRLSAEFQLADQCVQYDNFSKIQTRTMKACNECAKELGLTISSRCKLVIPKEKEPEKQNKFMKHA